MISVAYPKVRARKPLGDFIFLTVHQLCLLWWAYRTRHIQLMDFRVWFAAQEMVARRCQINSGQLPDYTTQELHGLVGGGGGEHLRASIRRLETLGLLTWSRTRLTFATSATALQGCDDLAGFHTMYAVVPNHARRVPVPRQTIRLIASGSRATVIATMLGHMLRCLYYREQRCISGGWCKASWIAEVFRMDQRNIKATRKHLVTSGWLYLCATPQAVRNCWGTYALVSLSWTRAAMEPAATDTAAPTRIGSPPPAEFCTTELPPLCKEHTKPLQEVIHQNPVPRADTASHRRHTIPTTGKPTTGVPQQMSQPSPIATSQPPTLSHIVPEDLQDTARLLALFTQAHMQGLIGKSASDRLTFLALAEHAKVVGSQNPYGLFAMLVRRQQWHFVTDSDEDAAHARLKQSLYGTPVRAAPPPALAPPELSRDTAIVRYLQAQLARAGWHGGAYSFVCREDPTWTRERWDCAAAELAQVQHAWQHTNALNRLDDRTGGGDDFALLGALVVDGDEIT